MSCRSDCCFAARAGKSNKAPETPNRLRKYIDEDDMTPGPRPVVRRSILSVSEKTEIVQVEHMKSSFSELSQNLVRLEETESHDAGRVEALTEPDNRVISPAEPARPADFILGPTQAPSRLISPAELPPLDRTHYERPRVPAIPEDPEGSAASDSPSRRARWGGRGSVRRSSDSSDSSSVNAKHRAYYFSAADQRVLESLEAKEDLTAEELRRLSFFRRKRENVPKQEDSDEEPVLSVSPFRRSPMNAATQPPTSDIVHTLATLEECTAEEKSAPQSPLISISTPRRKSRISDISLRKTRSSVDGTSDTSSAPSTPRLLSETKEIPPLPATGSSDFLVPLSQQMSTPEESDEEGIFQGWFTPPVKAVSPKKPNTRKFKQGSSIFLPLSQQISVSPSDSDDAL